MRTTIDWSYRLLDADEQQLFERLAVFANGFEIDAVVHVAQAIGLDCDEAIEALLSLVNKSMLAVHAHARGLRYRMLETMEDLRTRTASRTQRIRRSFVRSRGLGCIADRPCRQRTVHRPGRVALDPPRTLGGQLAGGRVLLAARIRSSDLARRLCGPPTQSSFCSAATTSLT